MASDVKFTVNKLTGDQVLIPATISEDLEQRFLKKAKSSSIKLIPVSFIVAAIVIVIAFLLIYFLKILAISTLGLISIVFPIYAIYDAFATSKAIKNHDYNSLSATNTHTALSPDWLHRHEPGRHMAGSLWELHARSLRYREWTARDHLPHRSTPAYIPHSISRSSVYPR